MNKDMTIENVERTVYGAIVRMARDIERCAMARDSAKLRTYYEGMSLEMRLLDALEEMMATDEE